MADDAQRFKKLELRNSPRADGDKARNIRAEPAPKWKNLGFESTLKSALDAHAVASEVASKRLHMVVVTVLTAGFVLLLARYHVFGIDKTLIGIGKAAVIFFGPVFFFRWLFHKEI